MRESVGSLTALLVSLLLIALYLAAPFSATTFVQAAGGEIRVVETQHEVNFPSGVDVSATIESDAAIQEIRVYYRPAGSRRWGYAYADFDPGTKVVATQSIPVRESTYIAPGADVEYFFEIRDVEGNVFSTELGLVEYLDQRFDWKRVQVGPLELVYHDIRQSRVEDFASALLEDLRRVEEVLHLDHSSGFKGVIYNSYRDANAAFPVQSQTTTDHGTFAGYAFPEQGVFVGQGLDRRIIVHESTHIMYHEALGYRTTEDVAWLNEGFASYMEPDSRVRSSSQLYGRTPPLKAMKAVSGTPSTIPLFYHKAESVVAHLIEEYGEENFRTLLRHIATGRTIGEALVAVYGFDEDGLDASWAGLPIPAPPAPTVRPQREARDDASSRPTYEPNRVRSTGSSGPATGEPPSAATPVAGAIRPTEAASSGDRDSRRTAAPTPPPPVPARGREEPSPFLFFDVWILAGVALLAASVLGIRFVYNRVRRTRETDNGTWEDWEDRD